MKVILSRKGFDSSNGGCPSPIFPDGTLLSIPIPSNDNDTFEEISFRNQTYAEILRQLKPNMAYDHCHVDPDIRPNIRNHQSDEWAPAFGQIDAAQGLLSNAGVEPGDLFLFFGWFRPVVNSTTGYHYAKRGQGDFFSWADMHVIYGYMQIGTILTDPLEIEKYPWHPHATEIRLHNKTNALYLPTEHLSWDPTAKGYGTLSFREDRVLTMKGKNRGTWKSLPFLFPEHIYGNRKNSSIDGGLYYCGIWQELVIFPSDELTTWVQKLIS